MSLSTKYVKDVIENHDVTEDKGFEIELREPKNEYQPITQWTEFVADTETSSYTNYLKEGEVRIILWGIESLDGSVYMHGTNGISLGKAIIYIAQEFNKATIYFHNAKYDWSYIAPVLLNLDFYTVKEPRFKEYTDKSGDTKRFRSYGNREIDVMRSVRGAFYQAHIQVGYKAEVKIVDSMKFYPGPLATYGDIFQVKKLYGEFDYEKYRPINYQFTSEEMEYFNHDIEILRRMMLRKSDDGKTELTRAGYAYNELMAQTLKDVYTNGSIMNKIENSFNYELTLGSGKIDSTIHSNYKLRNEVAKDFGKIFPETSLQFRNEIVDAYSGGFVWNDEEHPLIGEGVVYDCNSEYPAAMMNGVLPFGNEHTFNGLYSKFEEIKKVNKSKGFDTVAIFKLKAKFRLKKDTEDRKYFPVLAKKYSAYNTYVYKDSDLKARYDDILTLTNFDLIEFFRNYEVSDVKFIKGWWWFANRGIFKAFVENFANEKVKQTKGRDKCLAWLKNNKGASKEEIAKVQSELADHKLLRSESKQTLNSGYGKFAQSTINPSTTMSLGTDGVVRYETLTHSFYDVLDALETQGKFFPAGIFITAAARQILFKSMYAANKRVRYIDTDSVHLEGQEEVEGMDCDQSRLGAWKVESKFSKGHYLRPKAYEEFQTFPTDKNGNPFNKVTLAGFDEGARRYYFSKFGKLGYGSYGTMEVKDGHFTAYNGAQTTTQVPGGTLIIRRPKKITKQNMTGEALASRLREANFRIYKESFWNAYKYAIDKKDPNYFIKRIDLFNEFIKDNKIETMITKDPEHPYREMVLAKTSLCLSMKAFYNEFAKEYQLGYNKNEELGLI